MEVSLNINDSIWLYLADAVDELSVSRSGILDIVADLVDAQHNVYLSVLLGVEGTPDGAAADGGLVYLVSRKTDIAVVICVLECTVVPETYCTGVADKQGIVKVFGTALCEVSI